MNIIKDKAISEGAVVWITGLSGAGKSTFMNLLHHSLHDLGHESIVLDGDSLRGILGFSNKKYSKSDRLELAYVYSKLCKYLSDQGFTVLIATIALFHKIHVWNRETLPNYFEVFVDVPLSEIKTRFPAKVYENLDIKSQIVGVDFEAEFPKNPDMQISGNLENFRRMSQELASKINRRQV